MLWYGLSQLLDRHNRLLAFGSVFWIMFMASDGW